MFFVILVWNHQISQLLFVFQTITLVCQECFNVTVYWNSMEMTLVPMIVSQNDGNVGRCSMSSRWHCAVAVLPQTSHCPLMCLGKTLSHFNLKIAIACILLAEMYQKYLCPRMIKLKGMLAVNYMQIIDHRHTISNICLWKTDFSTFYK